MDCTIYVGKTKALSCGKAGFSYDTANICCDELGPNGQVWDSSLIGFIINFLVTEYLCLEFVSGCKSINKSLAR